MSSFRPPNVRVSTSRLYFCTGLSFVTNHSTNFDIITSMQEHTKMYLIDAFFNLLLKISNILVMCLVVCVIVCIVDIFF